MKSLSRFEYNLVRILHCFMQRTPLESVLPLIVGECKRPPCLSRDAVDLIQDTLAKGVTLLLARAGWPRERYLRGDSAVSGRIWERDGADLCGLEFSEQSLAFLQWITATELADAKTKPWKATGECTAADRLLFFFAYDALRHTIPGEVLAKTSVFRSDGLCALVFADDLAQRHLLKNDWRAWTTHPGSIILEAFQRRITERWLQMEQSKSRIADPAHMQRIGRTQRAILQSFLESVNDAGRRDLARFVLNTAFKLLPADPDPQKWIGNLNLRGLRMADRAETYRAAFAFVEQVRRLQEWEDHARTIGYFDEGYTAAQFWKSEWERLDGSALCRRADLLVRQAEQLSLGETTPAM